MPEQATKEFDNVELISENVDYSAYSPGDVSHPLQPIAVSPSTENIANSLGKAARWIEVLDKRTETIYPIKNLMDFAHVTESSHNIITYEKTYKSITVTQDNSDNGYVSFPLGSLPAGNYVVSFTVEDSTISTRPAKVGITTSSGIPASWMATVNIPDDGNYYVAFSNPSTQNLYLAFCAMDADGFTQSNVYTATDIMLCTSADWTKSNAFQYFVKTNTEMSEAIDRLEAEGTNAYPKLTYVTGDVYEHVAGVTAPEFLVDTYYSRSGSVYTLLLTEPDDWSTDWTKYYEKSTGRSIAIDYGN